MPRIRPDSRAGLMQSNDLFKKSNRNQINQPPQLQTEVVIRSQKYRRMKITVQPIQTGSALESMPN